MVAGGGSGCPVTEVQVEQAIESADDPKEAVVRLILQSLVNNGAMEGEQEAAQVEEEDVPRDLMTRGCKPRLYAVQRQRRRELLYAIEDYALLGSPRRLRRSDYALLGSPR
eukprot:COSAG02_NODE_34269_length_486_cov_1.436693_1_plen_110_part_01